MLGPLKIYENVFLELFYTKIQQFVVKTEKRKDQNTMYKKRFKK